MSKQYSAWFEDERETPMRVNMPMTLSFQGKKIAGSGKDKIGTFTIDGTVEDSSITFLKRYTTHEVNYKGTVSSLNPFKASGSWYFARAPYVNGQWGISED